jgi:tRNA pseudouridine13 synthase
LFQNGKIKVEPEDFIVEEIPRYEPSGEGTHTYIAVRKRNLSTLEAIRRIARTVGVSPREVGYAGLKDARALTTQMLSIEGISPERLLDLNLPNIEILSAKRHRNKLRAGHLKGNRFEIVIRDVPPDAFPDMQQTFERLKAKGVPNRFGEQRFGAKGDSHQLGRALLLRDWQGALDYFLGHASLQESEQIRNARDAYDAGDFLTSHNFFPPKSHADERYVLKALMADSANIERACMKIPARLRKLFLSAYQAHLFNRVLEARLPDIDRLYAGDLAYKHINGAVFLVEDPQAEQPRADVFEISPSGPIYGYKMTCPEGQALALETSILAAEGLTLESFRTRLGVKLTGARRALRMPLEGGVLERVDVGVRVGFFLPPGGYATVVVEELLRGERAL